MLANNGSDQIKNRLFVITGATAGIGRATAQALAGMGGKLVLIGRNQARCVATVEQIKKETGNNTIDFLVADLSSQKQVYTLAEQLNERYPIINVLINNAGGIFYRRRETVDGIEMTWALNQLAYFLLTTLLLDKIKKSIPARIINVSSNAHINAKLNFEDLEGRVNYDGWRAYGQSKLANLLFTYELAHRLKGTGVTVNALHPGYVVTEIGNKDNGLLGRVRGAFNQRAGARSPEKGAETVVYLATSPDVEGVTGKYFFDKMPIASSPLSYNEELTKRLWQICLAYIHVPLTV